MGKFKVGDRVRIGVAVNGAPVGYNGTTGTIEIVSSNNYKVRMDADRDCWWYQDDELTLGGSCSPPSLDQSPTLLDSFAMAALTGLLSDSNVKPDVEGTEADFISDVAECAYRHAQAMMKAREAQK